MELVQTGIPGVDEMLGGGIPKTSVVIVSGSPGIGKSNFAMEYIYNGVTKYDESGIYLTVEDVPKNIIAYANAFGWDVEKEIRDEKIAIVAQPIYGVDGKTKEN